MWDRLSLSQRTTPYPLLNQEGRGKWPYQFRLDELQPIGYSASVWLETRQVGRTRFKGSGFRIQE
jgi:hypothetical protein